MLNNTYTIYNISSYTKLSKSQGYVPKSLDFRAFAS
jgi:hypothetical protein